MVLPALYPEAFLDKDWYTEDEYFAVDDQSQTRLEWIPDGPTLPDGVRLGRIRMMSGGKFEHGQIAGNLITALNIAMEGTGNRMCHVFGSDVKVHTAEGRNTFPDVSVFCGKPRLHRGRRDIGTDPLLLAEVLSPSTESYDRGDKWLSYQTIPVLQHYLLISADRARVEVYTRQSHGWHFEIYNGLDAPMPLSALGVTLVLADLYKLVDFEDGRAMETSDERD
jgi:Uma2 family endonuclease